MVVVDTIVVTGLNSQQADHTMSMAHTLMVSTMVVVLVDRTSVVARNSVQMVVRKKMAAKSNLVLDTWKEVHSLVHHTSSAVHTSTAHTSTAHTSTAHTSTAHTSMAHTSTAHTSMAHIHSMVESISVVVVHMVVVCNSVGTEQVLVHKLSMVCTLVCIQVLKGKSRLVDLAAGKKWDLAAGKKWDLVAGKKWDLVGRNLVRVWTCTNHKVVVRVECRVGLGATFSERKLMIHTMV